MQLSTEIDKLKATVGVTDIDKLKELSDLAVAGLKSQLQDPNGAFANDPELALKATQTIAKINNDTIEVQRRVIDTLIRYHTATQVSENPANNLIPDPATEAPEIAAPGTSTFE